MTCELGIKKTEGLELATLCNGFVLEVNATRKPRELLAQWGSALQCWGLLYGHTKTAVRMQE